MTDMSQHESDALKSYAEASGFRLGWAKFRRHKLAVVSLYIVGFLYFLAIFAEFMSPYDHSEINRRHVLTPPQAIHFVDTDGSLALPYVRALKGERDPVTRRLSYVEDDTTKYPLRFFAPSEPYEMWGVIPLETRFIGIAKPDRKATLFLFGTDSLGRDVLSRIINGARVSLSIGLVGVAFSFVIGIVLGGMSGYYGGWIDTAVQRTIDFLQSLPTIPLWMGLAAAVPPGQDPLVTYLMITVILSIIGWTGIARVVRGRFLALREEDFVLAARFSGASEMRIILRHMVPSFASHIIASLSLSIPEMILAETALSFLGLGLQSPAVSWGVLLKDAQSLQAISQSPWLLIPGLAVVVTVLAFNFLGDGLRDASDPYGKT
ncbi:ABC transporter permease [Pacificibacter sp. AS14]|uniref:ABC transporter permease n=1 Tax=Pacificibacter sp. AS14 TaxID=3135785 RepID=UPI00317EA688